MAGIAVAVEEKSFNKDFTKVTRDIEASQKIYRESMTFRKPRIRPPVMIAGSSGAKISASTVAIL